MASGHRGSVLRFGTALVLLLALPAVVNAQANGERAAQGEASGPGAGHSVEPGERPVVSEADIARARARLAHEPSIEKVLSAVLAHEPPDTSEALASRARLSGLLPTLALKARRGQAVDLTATGLDESLRVGTDDDLTLEAALRFELDKLLFAREEVPLARDHRAQQQAREARSQKVIALYFERQRLLIERELERLGRLPAARNKPGAPAPDSTPLARELRIAELTAALDAFTGGAFSRMMVAARLHRP